MRTARQSTSVIDTLRRRRDMCPYAFRAGLVDAGFAWLGAEIGLFVDIRHHRDGHYFEPIRDAAGRVQRTETLAALIIWRANAVAPALSLRGVAA
jgi:hypothetical protein